MIEAICNELQCLPGDLFETIVTEASDEEINAIQSRVQPFRYGMLHKSLNSAKTTVEVEAQPTGTTSKPKQEKDVYLDSILGPKVSHLHAGKISKD
jgi:hypothetical protein